MNSVVTDDRPTLAQGEIVVEKAPARRAGAGNTTAVNPMQMLALAVKQGVGIDQLTQLMALSERWQAGEARKAFDAAMSDAKAKIKPIIKNRTVDFPSRTEGKARTHYQYEDLAAVAEAIDPILAEVGLSYRHRSKQEAKMLTITCIVSHRAGHFEETSLSAGYDESGNKNSIQGVGSTATYLQRYTLKLALGLAAAKDDDGNNTDHKRSDTVSEKQAADLKALISEHGLNQARFMSYHQIDSLEEILAVNFDKVVEHIKVTARNRSERR